MPPGTVHRGISNTSGEDRLIFFINYSPKPVPMNPHYSSFVYVPTEDIVEESKINQ